MVNPLQDMTKDKRMNGSSVGPSKTVQFAFRFSCATKKEKTTLHGLLAACLVVLFICLWPFEARNRCAYPGSGAVSWRCNKAASLLTDVDSRPLLEDEGVAQSKGSFVGHPCYIFNRGLFIHGSCNFAGEVLRPLLP